MDKDGTPELFIYNGDTSQICCIDYIYTYAEGEIKLLGSCGGGPRYFPGANYSGIYSSFHSSGEGSRSYVTKSGLNLDSEVVYSYDNLSGGQIEKRTDDDTLYHLFINESGSPGGEAIPHVTLSEIGRTGWEVFVNTVIPGTIPDAPVSKPTFKDIPANAFYAKPVSWAVENDITSGTSSNTFSPNAACTRGQIVTFLWRAQGKPEPSGASNPFVDVKPSDYFYKAVLWAVENRITAGTDSTHFSPDAICTRGQAVTFLWRATGEPDSTLSYNPFKDVKASAYYYDAVLWAADNGITAGTSGRLFSPEARCNRGQIVTFLYRHYVEPSDVVLPIPEDEIYKSVTSQLSTKAQTALYDINGDGTNELFIYYGEFSGKSKISFSIYTIKNGTAVSVIKDETLQMIVSAPSGGVGVVEKQGKRYVYTSGRNSGYTHPYTRHTGTVRLYSFNGTSLTLADEMLYTLRVKDNTTTPVEVEIRRRTGGSSVGTAVSYASYQSWVNSLKWKMKLGDVSGKVNEYF